MSEARKDFFDVFGAHYLKLLYGDALTDRDRTAAIEAGRQAFFDTLDAHGKTTLKRHDREPKGVLRAAE